MIEGSPFYVTQTVDMENVISLNADTRELNYTSSVSLPANMNMFVINSVTDITADTAYIYGFIPLDGSTDTARDYNNGRIRTAATFKFYEISPENLSSNSYSWNLSSPYCWLNDDTSNGNYHLADIHYTRNGWIVKRRDEAGNPAYYQVSADSSAAIAPSSISALNSAADAFSYDGKSYYFIDKRNIRLYKSRTPW